LSFEGIIEPEGFVAQKLVVYCFPPSFFSFVYCFFFSCFFSSLFVFSGFSFSVYFPSLVTIFGVIKTWWMDEKVVEKFFERNITFPSLLTIRYKCAVEVL